ncbi:MAG: kinase/pyrophosphorylase [Hydrogenophilaceae bacterium]|nr:kinase/pyrophosphorylase [Hydrogenophilaceae bacterium]
MSDSRPVFFVSDHTGITAELIGKSLLSQFPRQSFSFISLPFIDSEEKAEKVAQRIQTERSHSGLRPLVISTLTQPSLRHCISQTDSLFLDIFPCFLEALETELACPATPALGQAHGMSDLPQYRARMEAVNYALAADDGMATERYGQADLILVGVSRSGKTPTSLYMAMQYGLRVANYPLTSEDLEKSELPDSLQAHRAKLRGLTLSAQRLAQIREERRPNSNYASLATCQQELQIAERMLRAQGIPITNTTQRSIEEIAALLKQSLEPG